MSEPLRNARSLRISNEEYHASPALGTTGIKTFLHSREAFRDIFIDRTRAPEIASDNLMFGAAIHTVALEGVENTLIKIPEDKLAKNGAKSGNAWKDFAAECRERGLTPLKHEEYETLRAIVKNLKEHPRARELLYGDDAIVEESIYWTDEDTGLDCKCRPDVRRCWNFPLIGVDLKGMADISEQAFAKSIWSCGYYIQQYLYRQGMEALTGEQHDFVFVCVEKTWPHEVQCYQLNDEYQSLGDAKARETLEKIATCKMNGQWTRPGYDVIQTLPPPTWLKYQDQWEYRDGDSATD